MFTGIVSDIGEVLSVVSRTNDLQRVRIACSYDRQSIDIGASISCAGICLTVVETGQANGRTTFDVDTAAETLALSGAGQWAVGLKLNLERALKMGDELGGHMVSGHVDGLAELLSIENGKEQARFILRAPKALSRFIASKGSVALDGVSLTVNSVGEDRFSVLIIPHTLAATTLGAAKAGDRLNLEIDVMARYAARLLETQ